MANSKFTHFTIQTIQTLFHIRFSPKLHTLRNTIKYLKTFTYNMASTGNNYNYTN